ncbi:DUF1330 domain-containing protein [Caballeronia mineralivorans]|jgi:uncharacterized protein (DUF1330 family)|uniref:DUF1330 domain-containing protein n=1 Tax=Caballeronia mineralivorans TaxID=2010198 RepID=UPI002AFE8999|nr:DUF1330 domain-containing protein [Caballeronia mineralivorans]MEA3104268.1 hypothetical protein [Caballeronia mineralivorans]
MTKGYVFMNANVTDPERFAAYQPLSMQAIEAYGGKFLVRSAQSEALKGSMCPPSVVLECADYETAKKWYHSAQYEAARHV